MAPSVLVTTVVAAGIPPITPDPTGPGGAQLVTLPGILMFYCLLSGVAGVLTGAAMWSVGVHSNNGPVGRTGRLAVLWGLAAVLFIGASVALCNFALNLGVAVHA